VLVVDLDPQGNATRMLTQNSIYQYTGNTIMEAVQEGNAEPYIINVKDGLDLIPAEDHLATFSRHIYTARINKPHEVIKRLLEPIERRYDYVMIDVSPTLGDTVVNAIVYVDRIYIPLDIGDFAMDAMIRFTEFIDEAREQGHTSAVIDGILLTMRDGRGTRYEKDVAEGVREAYGNLVFQTEIHRRVRIKEMSSKGIDVLSDAMSDYMALTEEIIERVKGENP
jgi:chromosome partitioning protein